MKICFVCSEYPPAPHGGVGSMIQILGRALVRNGHQVKVIGVYPKLEAPAYQVDQGVEVWRRKMPERRFSWMAARYQVYRKVARWVRQGEIDLVEAPDWEGWAAGWPKLAVPVVVRLHGSSCYFASEMGNAFGRTAFWLERASLRRSDYYCSVSRYTAAKTLELFRLRAAPGAVIYNGVEIPPEPAPELRSRKQVIFTGTLTAKKGVISLIQSWPRVKDVCPDAELHIFGKDGLTAGHTSMREYLLGQLRGDCAPSVFFHGHTERERVLAALDRARAAVFPSYAEAFAMAPLEAMAHRCPTIYSNRGSGPELIEHGKHGLLADPDNPIEIAESILRILRDDSLAEQLGAAGRSRIQDAFSSGEMLRLNERFYAECIDTFRFDYSRGALRATNGCAC